MFWLSVAHAIKLFRFCGALNWLGFALNLSLPLEKKSQNKSFYFNLSILATVQLKRQAPGGIVQRTVLTLLYNLRDFLRKIAQCIETGTKRDISNVAATIVKNLDFFVTVH